MKNKRFAAAVMALAIAIAGIGFSGCGSNASATNAASNSNEAQITDTTINGTLWSDDGQMCVYTFDNNKKFNVTARKYNSSRYTADGTYTLKDGTLTLSLYPMQKVYAKTSDNGHIKFVSTEKSPYSLYTNQSAAEDSIAKGTGQASSQSSK